MELRVYGLDVALLPAAFPVAFKICYVYVELTTSNNDIALQLSDSYDFLFPLVTFKNYLIESSFHLIRIFNKFNLK
jgi:hypothetical protein